MKKPDADAGKAKLTELLATAAAMDEKSRSKALHQYFAATRQLPKDSAAAKQFLRLILSSSGKKDIAGPFEHSQQGCLDDSWFSQRASLLQMMLNKLFPDNQSAMAWLHNVDKSSVSRNLWDTHFGYLAIIFLPNYASGSGGLQIDVSGLPAKEQRVTQDQLKQIQMIRSAVYFPPQMALSMMVSGALVCGSVPAEDAAKGYEHARQLLLQRMKSEK